MSSPELKCQAKSSNVKLRAQMSSSELKCQAQSSNDKLRAQMSSSELKCQAQSSNVKLRAQMSSSELKSSVNNRVRWHYAVTSIVINPCRGRNTYPSFNCTISPTKRCLFYQVSTGTEIMPSMSAENELDNGTQVITLFWTLKQFKSLKI